MLAGLLTCSFFALSYILFATNVAGWQYDAALAQWKAQNVEEYEMDVENVVFGPGMGNWTLRVRNGKIVNVVSPYSRSHPTPATPQPPSGAGGSSLYDSVYHYTVEGRFEGLKRYLDGNQISLDEYCRYSFDPALGYVSSVDCHPKPWVQMFDADSTSKVTRLEIITRRTPTPVAP
jgi:hypothetical protein